MNNISIGIKKNIKILLLGILLAAVLSVITTATEIASGTVNGFGWSIDSEGTLSISGSGELQNFKTQSAPWNEYGDEIISARVESGITYLGNYTFDSLPQLTSVWLSATVYDMSYCAFNSCTALTSIDVDEKNRRLQDIDGVLYDEEVSVLIRYPDGKTDPSFTVPETVYEISGGAFRYSLIKEIILPEITDSICSYAFQYCPNLLYADLPDNLYFIGTNAFNKEIITLGGAVGSLAHEYALNNKLFFAPRDSVGVVDSGNCGAQAVWTLDSDMTLTVSGSGNMTEYKAVTSVPWYSYTRGIKNIVIEGNVTSVGSNTFNMCTASESMSISPYVTAINSLPEGEGLVIRGIDGCYAQSFANDRGIDFEAVAPVNVSGTSLVLDGSVGMKLYLDFFTIPAETQLHIKLYDSATHTYVGSNSYSLENGIEYSEGSYHALSYVAPKDADNIELHLYSLYAQQETKLGILRINDYMSQFRQLAQMYPNSEYTRALPLVEAMDVYLKYADNYFDKKGITHGVNADLEAINAIPSPSREGNAEGLEFYATSLILEDRITLRHYFMVTGDVSSLVFRVGDTAVTPVVSDGVLWVDITDISAQDMNTVYKLTVSDSLEVNCSVLNYIKLAVEQGDFCVSQLAKAMYNYHTEALAYFNYVPDDNADIWTGWH